MKTSTFARPAIDDAECGLGTYAPARLPQESPERTGTCPCGCLDGLSHAEPRSAASRSVERRAAIVNFLATAVGVLAAAATTFYLFTLIERWHQ